MMRILCAQEVLVLFRYLLDLFSSFAFLLVKIAFRSVVPKRRMRPVLNDGISAEFHTTGKKIILLGLMVLCVSYVAVTVKFACPTVKIQLSFRHSKLGLLHQNLCLVSATLGPIGDQRLASICLRILLVLSGLETNPGPDSPNRSWTPWDFNLLDASLFPAGQGYVNTSNSSVVEDTIPASSTHAPVICGCNVNSLTSKIDSDIRPLLQLYSFAALALQETKLSSSIKDCELTVENYFIFRRDRTRNGGGVALYVHERFNPRKVTVRSVGNLEFVAAELSFRRKRLIIGSVYKPPSLDSASFSDLADVISELRGRARDLVIVGDFNINALSEGEFRPLHQIMVQFGLKQLIEAPTHLDKCLDHIYASGRDCVAGIGPPIEKLHSITWALIPNFMAEKCKKCEVTTWRWEDADWDRARFLLRFNEDGTSRDLSAEISDLDLDNACIFLTNEIYRVQSLVVPHRSTWLKRSPCPWMNKHLLRVFQKRNVAYKRFKQTNLPTDRSIWKKLCKNCKSESKAAKKSFLSAAFSKVKTVKDYWRVVFQFLGKKRNTICDIKCRDGSYACSPKEKADAFAHEFDSNFNHGDDDYDHIYLQHFLTLRDEWQCTGDEVEVFIKKLENDAAMGLDQISPHVVKKCAAELAPALATLLNKCLQEGKFPSSWKHSRICPIPKVSGTNMVNEFRPISILPVLSKVAELWMKKILTPFIMAKADENQFAYSAGRSTEDALNLLQYYVTCGFSACQNTTKVAVVSFDVKKAFDQVLKNHLLMVLRREFLLPDSLACLVDSYLTGRKQTVVVGSETSEPFHVISGVAQGSILGPHLFNAFITSILNLKLSENSRLIAFADDLLMVKPIMNDEDPNVLQRDIDSIHQQYLQLHLSLNPDKTELMLCTLSNLDVNLPFPMYLAGKEIFQTKSLKYLGVILDQKLSFDHHAVNQSLKTKKAIGMLWRTLGKWTSREQFQKIYSATVLPILTYALPVACPSSKFAWINLEKANRFAARLACNKFTVAYEDLLAKLHWKPISHLCVERQLLLLFRYYEGLRYFPSGILTAAPQPIRQLRRQTHAKQVTLRFDEFHVANSSRPRRVTLGNIPLRYAVDSWNLLPAETVELPFAEFKKRTREFATTRILEAHCAHFQSTIPSLQKFFY